MSFFYFYRYVSYESCSHFDPPPPPGILCCSFQAYFLRRAQFILHYPSKEDWQKDRAVKLLEPEFFDRGRVASKHGALRVVLQAASCGARWDECFASGDSCRSRELLRQKTTQRAT